MLGKNVDVNDNDVTAKQQFSKESFWRSEMKQGQSISFDGSIRNKLFLRRSGHAYCPVCTKQVELIKFEDAAELFHTDLQDIQFLTRGGEVHQIHNRKGRVMACSVSLFECFDNRRTRLLDSGISMEIAAKKSA
ncbi:MAG: hypothetical protein AAB288_03270 [Acidobacteriota bacterium]